jgi:hypothetical protein
MKRALPWSLFAVAAAAAVALTLNTKDLAQQVGAAALRERALRSERVELVAGKDEATARLAQLEGEATRLLAELDAAQNRVKLLGDALAARAEQDIDDRLQRDAAMHAADAPMPEGVRVALLSLRDCARADGFLGLHFLSARGLTDQTLLDVELIDSDPEHLHTSLYLAARMTVQLDRAAAALTLRFFDGRWRRDGVVTPLPKDGLPLVLSPVTGKQWEQRLPYLVTGVGEYPAPKVTADGRGLDAVDAATRRDWMDRLNGTLLAATTELQLCIGVFHGMRDGYFLDVGVQGYDKGKQLQLFASCSKVGIEVDDDAGIVQLLLRDGTLHSKGGDSTIGSDGYRILLDGLTPKRARDLMLGMVVRK